MLAIVATIGGFIPGLFGKTLTPKIAKGFGIAILALALISIVLIGKAAYRASVVNEVHVEQEAVVARKTLEADREATAALENKAAAFDDTQAKLEEVTNAAEKAAPVEAKKDVGPVTSAYYAELRRQKEKR